MAGVTYFCTDSHGNTYTRFSARHVKPEYTFASIYRREGSTDPVDKGAINYSRQRAAAQAIASRFTGMTTRRSWDPETRGWKDDPHRLVAEVVAVRGYPGRHKVEPMTADDALGADWAPEPAGDTPESLSFTDWWNRFNQELSVRGLEHVGFMEARGFYELGESAQWASDAADQKARDAAEVKEGR